MVASAVVLVQIMLRRERSTGITLFSRFSISSLKTAGDLFSISENIGREYQERRKTSSGLLIAHLLPRALALLLSHMPSVVSSSSPENTLPGQAPMVSSACTSDGKRFLNCIPSLPP